MKLIFFFFGLIVAEAQQIPNSKFDIGTIAINKNGGTAAIENKMLIAQDGFLWYTTFEGLVKQYGSRSVVFPFKEKIQIRSDACNVIFEDTDQNIWIGTDRGLWFFNTSTSESRLYTWIDPDTENTVEIISILQSYSGDIVVTTRGRYLLELTKGSEKLMPFRIPDAYYDAAPDVYGYENYFVKLEETFSDGRLMLSQFNKYFLFDQGEITLLKDLSALRLPGNEQYHFKLVNNGTIFQKGTSGYYSFQGERFRYEYIPEVDRQLVQFYSDDFWIINPIKGSNKKVNICRPNPENPVELYFYSIDASKNLMSQEPEYLQFNDIITEVIPSHLDHFYVSTSKNIHAVRFKDSPFKNYLTRKQLKIPERNDVRGFTENEQGDIIIATKSGLYELSQKNDTIIPIDDSFIKLRKDKDIAYRDIFFRGPWLWTTSEDPFLRRIDLNNRTSKSFDLTAVRDQKSLEITCLSLWGEDALLIGTNNGLFSFDFRNNEIKDLSILNARNNLSNSHIKDIYVETEDKVWLATSDAGVFIKYFDSNQVDQYTKNNTNQILGSNNIWDIHAGQDGKIYLGTSNGLSILDTESEIMITYTKNAGLSDNVVVGMMETDDEIWIGTYNGLIAFNKKDDWFYNFYEKDGLPNNEFNSRSNFIDSQKNVYFGGLDGFARFHSAAIKYQKPAERIEIVEAEFFDSKKKSVLKSNHDLEVRLKEINLPYDKNFFNVSFAIPNPFFTNRPVYEYNLSDTDEEWFSLGNDTSLRLNTLPPGNHILNIRAKDASGNPTINSIRIPIFVSQVFYKKAWFIAANFLVLLLLSLGLYRFRQYRWEEKLRQQRIVDKLESKALRAQMNPHFIFNTLNGLQSTMILKGEREANKYLGSFSSLLRSTLDMSKSDHISLADEIKYLTSYLNLEKFRQARDLTTSITVLPEDLDVENIYIPCMIFQPLIENAILHGLAPKREGESKVDVRFQEEMGYIVGIITDNGIGRKASAAIKSNNRKSHRSWATTIMEERIEIINKYTSQQVDFEIEDLYEGEVAKGTRVRVKLPYFRQDAKLDGIK